MAQHPMEKMLAQLYDRSSSSLYLRKSSLSTKPIANSVDLLPMKSKNMLKQALFMLKYMVKQMLKK